MPIFSRRRRAHLPDFFSRRLLAALLCSTLLWWVPGSPALGPVAAGAVAPENGLGTPPPVPVTVASPAAVAPVVVPRGLTATIGRTVGEAWPDGTPTVVGDVVLDAYQLAALIAPKSCHLEVSLLAAIGQVESGNLADQRLDADHRPVSPVLGPVLDGSDGLAAVPDTDSGLWDHDRTWDRAVGPFQFIPGSWRLAGVDLDADGERDPQDIEDAAGAAMVYLCAAGTDLSTASGLRKEIFAYNHSPSYVRLVLAWKAAFDTQGLDLAEPPQLQLSAVQYKRLVKSLEVSTARTVRARASTGSLSHPGGVQAAGQQSEPAHAGQDPRPTPYSIPAPVTAPVSAGSPSPGPASSPAGASPSPSSPSPSSPAESSPAESSPAEPSPAEPSPEEPSNPPSDEPTAQDPSPEESPRPQPSEEPSPSPGEGSPTPTEPECPTPSPSPTDAGSAGTSPSSEPAPSPTTDPDASTAGTTPPPEDPSPSPGTDPEPGTCSPAPGESPPPA